MRQKINAAMRHGPSALVVGAFVAAALLAGALELIASAAFAGDGVNVNVTNDGVEDVYVTVYDATNRSPLIEHARLNGFSSLSVSATPDATGRASLSWTTISVDNRERHCGRGKVTALENDAILNVHADSSC